jgi:hypothetical protein
LIFFCISRTSLASGGHGREDGAAEPALSHKKAKVLAYWYYIAGSPPLDALLLILGKTLTVVNKKPRESWLHRPAYLESVVLFVGEEPRNARRRALTDSY